MKKSKLSKNQLKKSIRKGNIRKSHKKKYKIRNWSKYNESLVNRGSLELWIEKGVIDNWEVKIVEDGKTRRKRGSQIKYSARAIETVKLIGKIYHQRLRQTEGMTRSIFNMAEVNLTVPDYSTLSRRGVDLNVVIPIKPKGKIIASVDSTGLKVYGEGEWKVRQHGVSKRRTWMKLHVSIDRDGEIRAHKLTDSSTDDAVGGIELVKNQKSNGDSIHEFRGDGAYDKKKLYDLLKAKNVDKIIIPPRKGAKIWIHGNTKGTKHPRDENLREIRKTTLNKWKEASGYHARSLVENTMFRAKTIFGDRLFSRGILQQKTEAALMCKALNMMMHNGMPESYAAA